MPRAPNASEPTLDPVAAARWNERAPAAMPWLATEVARRMAERLPIVRIPVQRWVDWTPERGALQAHAAVAAHYPKAECFRVSAHATASFDATDNIAHGWRAWWRSRAAGAPATGAAASTSRFAGVGPRPPAGAAQLVWANLLAHQVADARALLAAWHEALEVGGFVMFSCLGPDSLREVRSVYASEGWPPPAHEFTDMHDWGDRLLTAGFADPVMDMEWLTLTFQTPARVLGELRELGRNLHLARFAGLRGRAWRERLEQALDTQLRPAPGEPLALTFEIIQGHAIKAPPRHAVQPSTTLSLDEMRQELRQRKPAPPPR